MKRFTTLKELQESPIPSLAFAAVQRDLHDDPQISHPKPYVPYDLGSVWLMQSHDTDETITAIFGQPLQQLSFDRVSYHPEEEHFRCHLVRNNSCCDSLVIPDAYWLDDNWRVWFIAQL